MLSYCKTNLFFNLISIAIFSFLNFACALHAPLSEAAIFNDDLPETENFRSIMKSSETRLSLTKSFYSYSFRNKYLLANDGIVDSTMNPLWQIGLSGYSFLLHPSKRLTIGINPSLIINAGIDFNYHLGHDYYLTGIANTLLSSELIFQKKLFHSNVIQGSLGICYRNEKQEFRNLSFDSVVGRKFNVEMYGIRYLMNFNLSNLELRTITAIYFENIYQTPVINIGLSYNGLFIKN